MSAQEAAEEKEQPDDASNPTNQCNNKQDDSVEDVPGDCYEASPEQHFAV